jgi:hypothetical protein
MKLSIPRTDLPIITIAIFEHDLAAITKEPISV